MPILEDNKFSFDDFASFEAINSWWKGEYKSKKDKEGYTPIGAAVLNGAPLECIAYLMQLYTFDGSPESSSYNIENPFRDISTDVSKGKSPLEIACMVMNADAVEVLMSDHRIYQLKDEDGNPIPKMTCYGDPLVDTDESGEVTREYFMYSSIPLYEEYTKESYKYTSEEDLGISHTYKCCSCTEADILTASILPKPDILIKFVDKFLSLHHQCNLSDVVDSSGNNPLVFACLANCYESVDYLLNNNQPGDNSDLVNNTNTDGVSALSVALLSNDQDLIAKLLDFVSIEDLLRSAFSKADHQMINSILLGVVQSSSNIYKWYDKSYVWSDEISVLVANYIEDENNHSLYELFNNDSYNHDTHFITLESNRCCHIIAVLYRNNKQPFNLAASKFNELINNHPSIYADTVRVLFDSGDVTLTQILSITDTYKRNTCISKIFTSYDKTLFSSLVALVDSSDTHDKALAVISHLYETSYFDLSHIQDLSKDEAMSKDILFEIIGYLNVSLSEIDSSISDCEFKSDLIKYLFSHKSISLVDIDSDIGNFEFKKSVIIDLFNDPDLDVTIEDLLSLSASTACSAINDLYSDGNIVIPDDVYTIYDHYSDSLSNLHNDLKPLIGCRKFIDSSEIASDFYWAYSFRTHTGRNWYNPLHYQNSVPPITDTSVKPVDGTRYKSVLLSDNVRGITFSPTEFRLARYNSLPEFYTSSAYSATSTNNGMIVSFNKSVVSYTFPLPDDMYLINDSNEITWNTDHPLYNLLLNNRCYSDADISVVIIFNKEHESITEGNSVTRNFRLSAKPKADVVLNISSNKVGRLSVSQNKLIFTSINWNVDQAVTFSAINDSIDNGNIIATITVSATSTDTRYNGISDSSLYFIVVDNDIAGVSYVTSSIELAEGASVTRSFKLNTKPNANVTIRISSDCSSRLSISPTMLTFTPDNWSNEKVVTFRALDNDVHDGDVYGTVTIRVESLDTSYNLISAPSISVIIRDNDVAVFGKLAFESGYFAVDTDPDYKLPILQKTKGAKPMHNTTSEWMKLVKTQWGDQYNSETDYATYQVPKSPKPDK